ncbi:glycosyltransferase [Vibrio europaeus]|uniref:glycosyltransferase n=1 Tax=Vibrio europaeus TaxID=300876 RepID=UPI0018A70A16|nr:glycosyltransferase [Vibrio europaeus]MDC5812475.1 glycosyltransferase [Vibrio europaeus]QPG33902.1 glycosyltransferase [Vibrio europaeus]
MKYIIVDPIGNSSGISSYTKFLGVNLSKLGIEYEIVSNTKKLNPIEFRMFLRNYITSRYGFNDVIIEAPEAKASTLLLPKKYNVHIRLHCPLAIAQKYDSQKVNENEYSNELRVINKARVVSSPSYGLLNELESEISTSNILVFKNPISFRPTTNRKHEDKKYDLVFMGRMQHLKGYDYIRKIIERLPEDYNVLIFGNNSDKLKLGNGFSCCVDVRDKIESDEKFNLISNSKVLMQLSRFENCSMVILESLSVGTPVVCWNVGGNAEIPSNGLIRPVTKNDIQEIVRNITCLADSDGFNIKAYESSIEQINKDFEVGIKSIIGLLNGKIDNIYKGVNGSKDNLSSVVRDSSSVRVDQLKLQRVMGIAFSNEHVEELWSPIINALGVEYRYVSRRPIGSHYVFNKLEPCFDEKYYCTFDWIKNPERLINQILSYKPNLILFHNGSHPSYEIIIGRIKELGIPIVYSELGWLPQYNHVYFDQEGVNGKSSLAKKSYDEIVKCCELEDIDCDDPKSLKGNYHLIATQLDNDTNLIVNSHRFKSRDSVLKYVLSQISNDEMILIKIHPKDKKELSFDISEYENVRLVNNDIDLLLLYAKSVISINSTVLIQALQYDCNIYYCGDSILDNKNIAQKFDKCELSSIISDELYCFSEKKRLFISAMKNLQINVQDLRTRPDSISSSRTAIKPFFDMELMDFTELIRKEKKKIVA